MGSVPPAPANDLIRDDECQTWAEVLPAEPRRAVLAALSAYLAQTRLTPFELLHHYRHERRLVDEAQAFSQAVVRWSASRGVHAAMRRLYELEADLAAALEAACAGRPLPERLVVSALDEPRFRRGIAVAARLEPLTEWPAKVAELEKLLAGGEAALADEILAEIACFADGHQAIFGWHPTAQAARLSGAVQAIALLGGTADAPATRPALVEGLRSGRLPRLMAELRGWFDRLLRSDRTFTVLPEAGCDPLAEADALLALRKAWAAVPAGAPTAEEAEQLDRRSSSLVEGTLGIGHLLGRFPDAVGRGGALVRLLGGLTGDRTMAVIARAFTTLLNDRRTREELMASGQPAERLRVLAGWQRAILQSKMDAATRDPLADLLDGMNCQVIRNSKLFEALRQRIPDTTKRGATITQLVRTNHFTRGKALLMAQAELKRS